MNPVNQITVYEVAGKRFDDYDKAKEYGVLCDKVDEIMKPLAHEKMGIDFCNGKGFIQHDPAVVATVRTAVTKLAKELFPNCNADCMLPRWACDSDVYCLYEAFTQLMCITSDGREYGQPYYATHPGEAKR